MKINNLKLNFLNLILIRSENLIYFDTVGFSYVKKKFHHVSHVNLLNFVVYELVLVSMALTKYILILVLKYYRKLYQLINICAIIIQLSISINLD